MEKYYVIYEGETLIYSGQGGEVFVPESMSIQYFETEYQAKEFINDKKLKQEF